ncbi:MAG: XylR N-terminal domain-containing protein [Bdellovibrionota bacterium]|nr:XylR N-terminal domain-containing protein [Bdellovibrionota bacterium]
MKNGDFDLAKLLKFLPEEGKIMLGNERVILFQHKAFGSLSKLLYEHLGDELARSILYKYGYQAAERNFEIFKKDFDDLKDPNLLALGPKLHAWEGVLKVKLDHMKFDLKEQSFSAKAIWANSYEGENYVANFGANSNIGCCNSLSGYASGWCTSFCGFHVIGVETKCIGKGDDTCEFEIRDFKSWNGEADKNYEYLTNDHESILKRLERSNEKLNHLNENLENEVKMRTEQISAQQVSMLETAKLGALGEMAGGIAHEINNPLAIIKTRTEILMNRIEKDEIPKEEVLRFLGNIEQTVERLGSVVRGLKNLSRSSDSDTVGVFKLNEVINDIIGISREKFKSAGIAFDYSLLDDDIQLLGGRVQIGQVVINLLNNAFDAAKESASPAIEIRAEKIEDMIRLQVFDSGEKPKKEVIDKMFNPFFTTKEIGKGTGLGLSISHSIVENFRAKLFYDNEQTRTCFTLLFPITKLPQELEDEQ